MAAALEKRRVQRTRACRVLPFDPSHLFVFKGTTPSGEKTPHRERPVFVSGTRRPKAGRQGGSRNDGTAPRPSLRAAGVFRQERTEGSPPELIYDPLLSSSFRQKGQHAVLPVLPFRLPRKTPRRRKGNREESGLCRAPSRRLALCLRHGDQRLHRVAFVLTLCYLFY